MQTSSYHIPNIILFYVTMLWLLVGVTKEWVWFAPAVGLGLVILQWVWLHWLGKDRTGLLGFCGLVLLFGIVADSVLIHLDLFLFAANPFRNAISPPWMMVIWLEFALCLYSSGRRMLTRYGVMSICAFLVGAVFYAALSEFSAVFFFDLWPDCLIAASVWAVFLPVCLKTHQMIRAYHQQ